MSFHTSSSTEGFSHVYIILKSIFFCTASNPARLHFRSSLGFGVENKSSDTGRACYSWRFREGTISFNFFIPRPSYSD
jgi:hypothetical protein